MKIVSLTDDDMDTIEMALENLIDTDWAWRYWSDISKVKKSLAAAEIVEENSL